MCESSFVLKISTSVNRIRVRMAACVLTMLTATAVAVPLASPASAVRKVDTSYHTKRLHCGADVV